MGLLSLTSTDAQSRWLWSPSVTLMETYDSNLFFRSPGDDDILSVIETKLKANYLGQRIGLTGTYQLQLQTYAEHAEENGVSQDGSVTVDLSRWFQTISPKGDITLSEDFSYTPALQDYFFDPSRQEVNPLTNYGIQPRKSQVFQNAFALGTTYPLSRQFQLRSRYSNLLTEYSDPLLQDTITNSISIGFARQYPKTVLSTDILASRSRWGSHDTNSYSYTVGMDKTWNQALAGSLDIGVLEVDSDQGPQDTTWNGQGDLSYLGRNFTCRIGYARSLNPSSGTGLTPPLAQVVYLSYTRLYRSALSHTLRADYAVNESLRGSSLETTMYHLAWVLHYPIRKELSTDLTASYQEQTSDSLFVEEAQRYLLSFRITKSWGE